MIYAIEILDSKFIKIGFSGKGECCQRISELQTGCPFEITERFTVEGTLRQEKAIHHALLAAFTRIRVPVPPNEWYPGRVPLFVEFLEQLQLGGPNQAMSFLDKYNQSVKQPGKGVASLLPNIKWPMLKA